MKVEIGRHYLSHGAGEAKGRRRELGAPRVRGEGRRLGGVEQHLSVGPKKRRLGVNRAAQTNGGSGRKEVEACTRNEETRYREGGKGTIKGTESVEIKLEKQTPELAPLDRR